MDLSVNWAAVGAAGVLYFLLGWLWYSPAGFMKAWAAAARVDLKKPSDTAALVRAMGLFLLSSLVMATALAVLLRAVKAEGVGPGVAWSLWISVGFTTMTLGGNVLAEGKSFRLFLINSGYVVVGNALMSAVLTLWK